MRHRGVSDDWSRGPLPTMDFLKREIRTLAAYKYNIFSPYFEHTFAYASTPIAAFPGGAITPDEARELVDYAAEYHIVIIPEQESFGHLHHVLKFVFPAPGRTLAPTKPSNSAWARGTIACRKRAWARFISTSSRRSTPPLSPTTSNCSSGATSLRTRRTWSARCPKT
jgi:hypothetical protein